MKGDFPDDTFTEHDVLSALEGAGLKHKNGSRYILTQCPFHDDAHPSAQIYKDDWFVNCNAGCGRQHITKAFPELRSNSGGRQSSNSHQVRKAKKEPEVKYKTYDLMDYWKELPLIPRDHVFKGIDLEILDSLGWRFVPDKNQYFIPYFSASKKSIPFGQYRNLGKDPQPRFIFLKDAKPTCYGTWNLDNDVLFVCEGASDAAVLDFVAVPWIALPSANAVELMKSMAQYCKDKGIRLVYAGDNDKAGDRLKEALDEVMPYRCKQPPTKYKDWGDFFEAEGHEAVNDYCMRELFPEQYAEPVEELSDVEKIQAVFPGAKELKVADSEESKEQSAESATLF